MSFDPVSFDPVSFDPLSFDPLSVNPVKQCMGKVQCLGTVRHAKV